MGIARLRNGYPIIPRHPYIAFLSPRIILGWGDLSNSEQRTSMEMNGRGKIAAPAKRTPSFITNAMLVSVQRHHRLFQATSVFYLGGWTLVLSGRRVQDALHRSSSSVSSRRSLSAWFGFRSFEENC
ncbi:hypothetical protein FRC03_006007 [Tulasnella sp. 419]|nr:hypothetical protein FRC03_006007 [Tulasnella sp. 419]